MVGGQPSCLIRYCLTLFFAMSASAVRSVELEPRTSTVACTPDVQYELQSRLIDAAAGDVIQLEAGTYHLHRQLDITTSNLTIRGAGSAKTLLSFQAQDSGGAGIEATGDNLLVEGLAIEDTAGNGIKVLGARGVTFRDVRVEWTGPPQPTNGAYGIYPVQCENVLLETCTAIGASDAGIYVGQCRNVIVRNNRAERNVAGIEIENTVGADVFGNQTTNNTAGILVFDLPGLQISAGNHVRVFRNSVTGNNHLNFAAKGNIVASVPPGTGVMVMATDEVEVFDNDVHDHRTGGIAVLSYRAKRKMRDDEVFDPYPESISIHDNRVSNSGYAPAGEFGTLLAPVLGGTLPDILWDGVVDPTKFVDAAPAPNQIPSIVRNGTATFVNFDYGHLNPQDILAGRFEIRRDLAEHRIPRPPLAETTLPVPEVVLPNASSTVRVYRDAKKHLSQYELFVGDLAAQQPAAGVFRYELNTALFSDYTSKYRFVKVPAGTRIQYRDEGVFDFPVGTIIAKTFAYQNDMDDPDKGRRLLETRIELRRDEGWYGFSYLWNDQQSDADLVLGGSEIEVSWTHFDGKRRTNKYQIPNANQCLNCHQQGDDFFPLGPVAANLNREFDDGRGARHQLVLMADKGFLDGAPHIDSVQSWPRFEEHKVSAVESAGEVKTQARTWLHVNCAHCHNPIGTARTSGLDLRLTQMDAERLGIWKTPVAAGHGSGGRSFDIVPGKPDESILMYRIEATDPSIAMPNVSRRLVPVEAASLVRQWIKQMEE